MDQAAGWALVLAGTTVATETCALLSMGLFALTTPVVNGWDDRQAYRRLARRHAVMNAMIGLLFLAALIVAAVGLARAPDEMAGALAWLTVAFLGAGAVAWAQRVTQQVPTLEPHDAWHVKEISAIWNAMDWPLYPHDAPAAPPAVHIPEELLAPHELQLPDGEALEAMSEPGNDAPNDRP